MSLFSVNPDTQEEEATAHATGLFKKLGAVRSL